VVAVAVIKPDLPQLWTVVLVVVAVTQIPTVVAALPVKVMMAVLGRMLPTILTVAVAVVLGRLALMDRLAPLAAMVLPVLFLVLALLGVAVVVEHAK
jgi:hypothetical protein